MCLATRDGMLSKPRLAAPPSLSAVPTSTLHDRQTWAPLNESARGALFFARRAELYPTVALPCPKVGLDYFWYPALGKWLRGAKSLAPIAKGEEICVMPVQSLLSDMTVLNSTFRTLWESGLDGRRRTTKERQPAPRRSQLAADMRVFIVLYVLREVARECAAPAPRSAPHRLHPTPPRVRPTPPRLHPNPPRLHPPSPSPPPRLPRARRTHPRPHLERRRADMMAYLNIIQTHDVTQVPVTFDPSGAAFRALSPNAQRLARQTRAHAMREFPAVSDAVSRHGALFSEGIRCEDGPNAGRIGGVGVACTPSQLRRIYSPTSFLETYARVRARDWILPM